MLLPQKKRIIMALISLLLAVGLVFPASGFADDTGDTATPASDTPFTESQIVPGKVIVKYKSRSNNGELNAQSRSPASSPFSVLSFDEQIAVKDKLIELQRNPDIEYAEPVYKTHLIASSSNGAVSGAVYSGSQEYMEHWGKLATDLANRSPSPTQNQQITVAVIDTGVDIHHPDLQGSIVPGRDFVNNDEIAQDDNGHGTHVSGVIASNSVAGNVYGVAPGVKIMPLKVLDGNGTGDSEQLINALQYAIANHADIVNMSLGIDGDSQALRETIKQAYGSGLVLVAAAGNESNHWIANEDGQLDNPATDTQRYVSLTSYPAAYDEVISVGAIEQLPDLSFAVADFSNVGKVDIVAPGVNIYSTALGGGYVYKSGTSQATPFVSGLAALLKATNAALDNADIRTILGTSAKPGSLQDVQANRYVNLTEYPNDHVSPRMAYGDGMIQGGRAFSIPRLELTPVAAEYPASRTLTYDAKLLDVHNTVVPATYEVHLNVRAYDETVVDREQDPGFASGSDSSGFLADGYKRLAATLNSNDPVHHIYIFGSWEEPVPTGGYYTHRSNSYTFLNRPSAPIVSLQAGTYTGGQTVRITSPYQEGKLYYMLQTEEQTSYGTFNASGGSLQITRDSLLTVATLHNLVYSDDGVYLYRIQAKPAPSSVGAIGGGGLGGGGGSSSQSPPSKDADGKMTYILNPPRVDLLIALASSSNELLLDATIKEKLDKLIVKFDADLVPKAWSRGKSLVIRSNELTVSMPPDAFQVKSQDGTIQFTTTLDAAPVVSGYTSASALYEIALTEKGEPIAAFDKPVQVTFPYDSGKVSNSRNLGVYVLNEQTGEWDDLKETLNDNGTITADLPHFSQYAVLEKKPATDKQQPPPGTPTFADIQNHWAKPEIEKLAAARLVDGVSDTSFEPDANMTRAQLVTLLAKALQLQSNGSARTFRDVSGDSWYAKSVYAAYEARIVSGVSEEEFAPDAPITREQMAVMLVNAYLYATGKTVADVAVAQEVQYSDEGSISDWARSYVRVASGLGLVNGTDAGNFSPSANTTRAQAAVVLYRMLEKIK